MAEVSLREAIARYAAEDRAPVNSYEWYRRSARERGSVWIGSYDVVAHKVGRAWFVNEADLERGIASHRADLDAMLKITDDYRNGVLHGRSGDTIYTEWGGYRRRDPFHFAWSTYEVHRRKSDGRWYCNSCMKPAESESEWSGGEFMVIRVRCEQCGSSLAFDE